MKCLSAALVIVLAAAFVIPANADSNTPLKEPVHQTETPADNPSGVRSEAEIEALLAVYREVFPEEYHYIQEYLDYGINPLETVPELLFEDTRTYHNTDYTLSVYSNRQLLTVVIPRLEDINERTLNYPFSEAYNAQRGSTVMLPIQLGDLGHYITFNTTFYVNESGYDHITNVVISGSSWVSPFIVSKQYEDASGCAYYAYKNAYCTVYGLPNNILYNMGVSVGNNTCVGYTRIADDWSVFLSLLLYML